MILFVAVHSFSRRGGVARRIRLDAQKIAANENCALLPLSCAAGREEKEKPAVAGFMWPLSFFFDGVVVRRDAMHFLREEKRQCKKGTGH